MFCNKFKKKLTQEQINRLRKVLIVQERVFAPRKYESEWITPSYKQISEEVIKKIQRLGFEVNRMDSLDEANSLIRAYRGESSNDPWKEKDEVCYVYGASIYVKESWNKFISLENNDIANLKENIISIKGVDYSEEIRTDFTDFYAILK